MEKMGKNTQKTYVFDLDGTLVDSMPTGVGIILSFLTEKGIPYPSDIVNRLTPLGYKGSAEYIAEHLSADYDFQYVYERFKTETRRAYGESIPLKPHVKETLVTLYERGYCLNVLTACPKELTELCLKRLDVFGLFENVWSIEDFSLTKANAQLYEVVANRLGVPLCECVMVDDNLNVIKIAKQVGMRTVGVYDESTNELQGELQREADVYVRDFAELLARID